MRKTQTVLASLAAGGLLIGAAVLAAPMATASTQVTCAQAQIDLSNANTAEQGPAATLAVAKSADNSAHAALASAISVDASADAVTPDPPADGQDTAITTAQGQITVADAALSSAQAAEAITARALARAEREVNTCGSIPTPTPAPVTVTVTPPPPPAATTPVYQIVNGQRCQLINGQWVPVAPAAVVPAPSCGPCSAPAPAPATQTVVEQIPTVTVPPAQAFTTQVAPSIPVTSAGDGSLRIDPTPVVPVGPGVITVTLDLGGILQVIQLPSLPVIPVLSTP